MRKENLLILIYGLLILVGGSIGFIKADSWSSLLTALVFAGALLLTVIYEKNEVVKTYQFPLALLSIYFIFFSVRFFLSFKWMPSGMMAFLTAATIGLWILIKRLR